jgi:hypothetical protein
VTRGVFAVDGKPDTQPAAITDQDVFQTAGVVKKCTIPSHAKEWIDTALTVDSSVTSTDGATGLKYTGVIKCAVNVQPTIVPSDKIKINDEIFGVKDVTDKSMTVVKGMDGTHPTEHAAQSKIYKYGVSCIQPEKSFIMGCEDGYYVNGVVADTVDKLGGGWAPVVATTKVGNKITKTNVKSKVELPIENADTSRCFTVNNDHAFNKYFLRSEQLALETMNGNSAPTRGAGYGYIKIDDEIFLLTEIRAASHTICIKRGALGSVPTTHSASSQIYRVSPLVGMTCKMCSAPSSGSDTGIKKKICTVGLKTDLECKDGYYKEGTKALDQRCLKRHKCSKDSCTTTGKYLKPGPPLCSSGSSSCTEATCCETMKAKCSDTTGLANDEDKKNVVKPLPITNKQCGRNPESGRAKSANPDTVNSACQETSTQACNFCKANTQGSAKASPDVETCCKDCSFQEVGCADDEATQKAASCVEPPKGYGTYFPTLLKCTTPKEGYMIDQYGIVYEAQCGKIAPADMIKRGLVDVKDTNPVSTPATEADPETGFFGSCDKDTKMFSGQTSSCEVKCSQYTEEVYDEAGKPKKASEVTKLKITCGKDGKFVFPKAGSCTDIDQLVKTATGVKMTDKELKTAKVAGATCKDRWQAAGTRCTCDEGYYDSSNDPNLAICKKCTHDDDTMFHKCKTIGTQCRDDKAALQCIEAAEGYYLEEQESAVMLANGAPMIKTYTAGLDGKLVQVADSSGTMQDWEVTTQAVEVNKRKKPLLCEVQPKCKTFDRTKCVREHVASAGKAKKWWLKCTKSSVVTHYVNADGIVEECASQEGCDVDDNNECSAVSDMLNKRKCRTPLAGYFVVSTGSNAGTVKPCSGLAYQNSAQKGEEGVPGVPSAVVCDANDGTNPKLKKCRSGYYIKTALLGGDAIVGNALKPAKSVTASCELCPHGIPNTIEVQCTDKPTVDDPRKHMTGVTCANGFVLDETGKDSKCVSCMVIDNAGIYGDGKKYVPGQANDRVAKDNSAAGGPRVEEKDMVLGGKWSSWSKVDECSVSVSRLVTCKTGFYKVDNSKMVAATGKSLEGLQGVSAYISDECKACKPVANARSVSCLGPDVSKATCKSGYALTKGTLTTSDRCDPPPPKATTPGSSATTTSMVSMLVGTVLSAAAATLSLM